MLERLRNQIGTAGLIVAIVALVAALGGGAYAATGGSGGGKATASAKQGKQGKPGKTGKTGPAGPAGPAGAAGPAGPAGAKGDTGAPGASGTSVANTAEPKGANCAEGGTKLVGTSTSYACNGTKGAAGKAGDPWTLGGTLPEGATETGAWAFGPLGSGAAKPGTGFPVTISVPIPLAAGAAPTFSEEFASNEIHVVWDPGSKIEGNPVEGELSEETFEFEPSVHCSGSATNPKADPGHLCIYVKQMVKAVAFNSFVQQISGDFTGGGNSPGMDVSGAVFVVHPEGGELLEAYGSGSWAVTAP